MPVASLNISRSTKTTRNISEQLAGFAEYASYGMHILLSQKEANALVG